MKTTDKPVRVVFRHDGDVFALFPDLIADNAGNRTLYAHIGQHSAGNYLTCIRRSRPATPEEYAPLAAELRRIGYTLDIKSRR